MICPSLQAVADHFYMLPGEISDMARFEEQWKNIMGGAEAKKSKGVVYVWTAATPIPRLKGSSNIIYIGKTVNSIHARHFQWGKLEATGSRNKPRYNHILEHFGPIRIHVASFKDIADELKPAEQRLLQMYFDQHLEYPPLNRMGK